MHSKTLITVNTSGANTLPPKCNHKKTKQRKTGNTRSTSTLWDFFQLMRLHVLTGELVKNVLSALERMHFHFYNTKHSFSCFSGFQCKALRASHKLIYRTINAHLPWTHCRCQWTQMWAVQWTWASDLRIFHTHNPSPPGWPGWRFCSCAPYQCAIKWQIWKQISKKI